jgi:hypothetical protein
MQTMGKVRARGFKAAEPGIISSSDQTEAVAENGKTSNVLFCAGDSRSIYCVYRGYRFPDLRIEQINTNFQSSSQKTEGFGILKLVLRIYLGFGACFFGISVRRNLC